MVRHAALPRGSGRRLPARGFTLVELIVAVAVLAVLLSLAAPSFRGLLEAQRMRSAAFDLMADLTLARSEALKRGANVVLTPATGGWTQGWTITTPASGGGNQVLGEKPPLGGGVNLPTAPVTVTFDRNGRVAGLTDVARFSMQTATYGRSRCISLDPSGRPKSYNASCPSSTPSS